MKCKIYKITNDINNKIYVGKTASSLDKRFQEHERDSRKTTLEKRPLYNAIRKYGIQHFEISLIEECDSIQVDEREIYWIEYYHGYSYGYNATIGGDGTTLYDYDEIAQLIHDGFTTIEIKEKIGCCADTVRKISTIYNLIITESSNDLKVNMSKSKIPVSQYDKQNNFIQNFNSYADAARWLQENNYVNGNLSGVRSKIGEVCTGKRKTAYQFIWRKRVQ